MKPLPEKGKKYQWVFDLFQKHFPYVESMPFESRAGDPSVSGLILFLQYQQGNFLRSLYKVEAFI